MQVLKSFFQIGVYNPEDFSSWPWHYNYEYGQYLSAKKRICSWIKPAEFETAEAARLFYHSWKHRERYKMEIIEVKRWVDVPEPEYPDEHPRTIFNKILRDNISSCYKITAVTWFEGIEPLKKPSQVTYTKHRTKLLQYGIDIAKPINQEMATLWQQTAPSEIARKLSNWDFQYDKPSLTIVKNDR